MQGRRCRGSWCALTCQVLRQQLSALVADAVGAQQQAAQRVVALQRLSDGCHAEHADAIVAEVRYLTPAPMQAAQLHFRSKATWNIEHESAVGSATEQAVSYLDGLLLQSCITCAT